MKFLDALQRLQRLDRLIRTKATGDIKSLADKLEVSERTAYNLLDHLRELGAEIEYCHNRHSYHYPNGTGLQIKIKLDNGESIRGGSSPLNYSNSEIFSQGICILKQ